MDVNCTVITGYHGTSSNYAESIEKHGLDPDKTHTRPDHWLGQGVYFFEDSDLAKWWACDISGKECLGLTTLGSDSSNLFEDEKKTVADKYTQKVRHLLELKNKLSREEILLKEQRYLLEDNGHYELIHSIEQKELICGCTLFNLMNFKENEILKKIMRLRLFLLPRLPLT